MINRLSISETNALDRFPELRTAFQHKQLILFLDYDGTLTPIVADPQNAILSQDMKHQLVQLKDYFVTGVISGRSLAKLTTFVQVDGIYYAGSHGFDIIGPNGTEIRNQVAEETLPELAAIRDYLVQALESIEGASVEDNLFSITVHYRNVQTRFIPEIDLIVEKSIALYPSLRRNSGKMVYELKPKIAWNKGKAVLWLLQALRLNHRDQVYAIYIGDDTTDEDAFEVFQDRDGPQGVGVFVSSDEHVHTKASFTLRNPDEVRRFLELINAYGKECQQL